MLHDDLKLERVAPGHCTSALGIATLLERIGTRYDENRRGRRRSAAVNEA